MQWTTTNVGVGVTRVDNWVDRVYMSPDTSLGESLSFITIYNNNTKMAYKLKLSKLLNAI